MKNITTYDKYLEIKNQYKNGILLFQSGDFLRGYFNDALIMHSILDYKLLVLSLGDLRYCAACGFSQKHEKSIVKRLIDKGYKVVVCRTGTDPDTLQKTKEITGEFDKPGYKDLTEEWDLHFHEFDGKSEDELCQHFKVPKIKRPEPKKKVQPSSKKQETIDMSLYTNTDHVLSEEERKNHI